MNGSVQVDTNPENISEIPEIIPKNANQTAFEDRIPMIQKIAFGVGSLANQLFAAALGVFMSIWCWLPCEPAFCSGIRRFYDSPRDGLRYGSVSCRYTWGCTPYF